MPCTSLATRLCLHAAVLLVAAGMARRGHGRCREHAQGVMPLVTQ